MHLPVEHTNDECRLRAKRTPMQKQELIHLHRLFVEITQNSVDKGEISPNIWTDYQTNGVNAHAIHVEKPEHKEAILLLALSLRNALDKPIDKQSLPVQ